MSGLNFKNGRFPENFYGIATTDHQNRLSGHRNHDGNKVTVTLERDFSISVPDLTEDERMEAAKDPKNQTIPKGSSLIAVYVTNASDVARVVPVNIIVDHLEPLGESDVVAEFLPTPNLAPGAIDSGTLAKTDITGSTSLFSVESADPADTGSVVVTLEFITPTVI